MMKHIQYKQQQRPKITDLSPDMIVQYRNGSYERWEYPYSMRHGIDYNEDLTNKESSQWDIVGVYEASWSEEN